MINSAVPELLELAKAVRGDDWRDELGPALVAAKESGWTWKRTLIATARLLADENARPRDLTAAVRKATERVPGSPPSDEYHVAREALEEPC